VKARAKGKREDESQPAFHQQLMMKETLPSVFTFAF
jgi:hypothetical protein